LPASLPRRCWRHSCGVSAVRRCGCGSLRRLVCHLSEWKGSRRVGCWGRKPSSVIACRDA
jgi:hypothetical protein